MNLMTRALLVGLMAALTLTACGDDGKDGGAVASLDGGGSGEDAGGDGEDLSPEDAAMEFARCMRENGVPDFPDPEVDDEGRVMMRREARAGQEVDRATEEKAMEECGHLLQDLRGSFSEEDRAEMQDRFLEYAACMREQGIDMPDPDFSGEGGGAFRMEEPEDPEKFEAAQKECEDLIGAPPGAAREGAR